MLIFSNFRAVAQLNDAFGFEPGLLSHHLLTQRQQLHIFFPLIIKDDFLAFNRAPKHCAKGKYLLLRSTEQTYQNHHIRCFD